MKTKISSLKPDPAFVKNYKNLRPLKLDLNRIEILYKISSYLSIVPPLSIIEDPKKSRVKYHLKGGLMILLICFLCIYSSMGRIIKFGGAWKLQTRIIRMIISISVAVVNVASVQTVGKKVEKWRKMLEKLKEVDKILNDISGGTKVPKLYFIFEISLTITLLVNYAYHMYLVAQKIGWLNYHYFLFSRLQNLHLHCLVLLMLNILVCMRKRFEVTNWVLKKRLWKVFTFDKTNVEKLKFVGGGNEIFYSQEVDSISNIRLLLNVYVTNCEISKIFSDINGIALLFLMLIAFLGILEISSEIVTGNWEDQMFFQTLLSSFTMLFWGYAVLYFCDQVVDEAKLTATISHKLLVAMPIISPERDVLRNLVEYSTHHLPIFSAANILDATLANLFAVFSYIVTYVVILIQFNVDL